jgi:hypothetical protein
MVSRLAIEAKALYVEAFGELGWRVSLWEHPRMPFAEKLTSRLLKAAC